MPDCSTRGLFHSQIHSWSGSIEIGVTSVNPATLEALPACATKLFYDTWVMSGNSILRDGNLLHESYGIDLDKMNVADRIGVMRTSAAELVFHINGEPQGTAAVGLPRTVFALVNLYGKCVQVSICPGGDATAVSTRTPAFGIAYE